MVISRLSRPALIKVIATHTATDPALMDGDVCLNSGNKIILVKHRLGGGGPDGML